MSMSEAISISASLEDYLEAIFHVVVKKHAARAKDISKRLGVNSSSVTGALHSLADKGLINYAPYDLVTLTDKGQAVAKDVIRRHEALRDFFVNVLVVNEVEADKAACRMEHAIPQSILDRLIQFVEFVQVCPRGGTKWVKGFGYYCESSGDLENCERCISLCLEDVRKRKNQRGGEGKMTVALRELKPGQKGKIVGIKGRGETNKRIVDMGVTPGTLIEVERVAPLGDPIDVKVKGYHLSLRKEEAGNITVELQ